MENSLVERLSDFDELADLFGDEEVDQTISDAGSVTIEHMNKPQEAVFSAVAKEMVASGWSIYPQEMTERRQPGRVNRKMIRPAEEHKLTTQLPKKEALELWMAQCGHLNVAVVFGPASGNTFVIDIDVVELTLSFQIRELASRILGDTPLQRVGSFPKIALVYRHAEGEVIESRSPKFAPFITDENPSNTDQGVEIISTGKTMTFYGKHWKTGNYFQWLHGTPQTLGPDKAPVVTAKQVADFMDAVDSLRQYKRASFRDDTITTWEFDPDAKVNVPSVRSAGGAMDWIEDDEGKVVDGREAYLTRLAYRIVTANPSVALDATMKAINPAGLGTLAKHIIDQFQATAVVDGKWNRQLTFTARDKVRRVAEKLARGEVQAFVPKKNADGTFQQQLQAMYLPAQPRKLGTDNLAFLPPFVDPTAEGFDPTKGNIRRPLRMSIVPLTDEQIEANFKEREIEENRTRIAKAVSEGLLKSFSYFWDEVYDQNRCTTRIHILKAPTGAGKTSRGISFIAEDPRTKENYMGRDDTGTLVDMGRAPILVLMPTYANIDELRHRAKILNLDPTLSDHELRAEAKNMNLIHEDDLPEKLAELRRDAKKAGVETMIYQGKIRAGCKMKDMVEMAMAAGLGTSGFCEAEIVTPDIDAETGEPIKKIEYCPFYSDFDQVGDNSETPKKMCPAIKQKYDIANAHVVFMPHAFLALNIPEELKNVRAVVADERIHHLFLHTAVFPLETFNYVRKTPKILKSEKEAGVQAEDFVSGRQEAIGVVQHAIQQRKCPVEALLEIKEKAEGTDVYKTVGWVDGALRSCGASLKKESDITPLITAERLAEICNQPTGKYVREEYHFWKIIQERMSDRLIDMNNTGLKMPNYQPKAIGDREMRIQYVTDVVEEKDGTKIIEQVRISWRTEPNWLNRPLLLLDASAAPKMIEKIWCGKEVVVHDIPAPINTRTVAIVDRTYSNASVVAKPSSTAREKLQSAQLMNNLRRVLSLTSAMYGWGRVVAGGSILVRKVINKEWSGPSNIDWCHFGAMRGLDFAKYHNAAVSVGRMELPTRVVDGLVAALTYDDPIPEIPFDKYGTGKNDDGGDLLVPSRDQIVKMRSGHDIVLQVPKYDGEWARMIQRQYREEELLQFLGRLRPVYREGEPPIWFSLSSVIPEEVVVDDMMTLQDLLRRGKAEPAIFESMRRGNGVIEPELTVNVAPDHFGNVDTVRKHMKMEGLNSATGEIDPRLAWGIVALKFQDQSNTERYAFVRGDLPDAEAALRNEMRNVLNMRIKNVRKISQSRGQTMAKGRLPDKIELELGTLEERRLNETRRSDEVALTVLATQKPEHLAHLLIPRVERPLPVLLGTGVKRSDKEDSGEYKINFSEMATKLTTDTFWKEMGYGAKVDEIGLMDSEKGLIDSIIGGADDVASDENDYNRWDRYLAMGNADAADVVNILDTLFEDEEDEDAPW
jgi:hypothetical protein